MGLRESSWGSCLYGFKRPHPTQFPRPLYTTQARVKSHRVRACYRMHKWFWGPGWSGSRYVANQMVYTCYSLTPGAIAFPRHGRCPSQLPPPDKYELILQHSRSGSPHLPTKASTPSPSRFVESKAFKCSLFGQHVTSRETELLPCESSGRKVPTGRPNRVVSMLCT